MKKYLILSFLFCFLATAHASDTQKVEWHDWSKESFALAKQQQRLIVLDLAAIWCHWCHVMDEKTYSDPAVISFLQKNFVAIQVDQDSRPDVSKAYENYGWPATIFFNSNGEAIAKRAGYIEPKEFLALLQELVKDPSAEEENKTTVLAATSPYLSKELKAKMLKLHWQHYNKKLAGFGASHEFLYGAPEEWLLAHLDPKMEKKTKDTLNAALALVDPVWGGVYQYSVDGWTEPHFEKIAEAQSINIQLYSLAFSRFSDPKYAAAANSIFQYLHRFLLSPAGAFYTSQDADLVQGEHSAEYFSLGDKERIAKGVPRIDKNIYARENGWLLQGLADYVMLTASSSPERVDELTRAADWILQNRALPGGGFRHGEKDSSGPFLGDNTEMLGAFLKLYEITADKRWLKTAENTGNFILEKFSYESNGQKVGFRSALGSDLVPALPYRDENVRVARTLNLLYQYDGKENFKDGAVQAMRFLANPSVALQWPTAGILLADEELNSEPLHVTIVGSKKDPTAKVLFTAALGIPKIYRRIEWYDASEGFLPHMDVPFPKLKTAAAFVCNGNRCSLPIKDAQKLLELGRTQ